MGGKMAKKLKKTTAGCETCVYGKGKPQVDEADKETMRIYCAARFVEVDIDMMTKYCDFWEIKPPEREDD